MLYHLLYPFSVHFKYFHLFRYITIRAFIAFVLATTIAIIWGRFFIAYMKKRQFGQIVRDDGPKDHLKKMGTPTFGGVFILGSVFLTMGITGNFHSLPLWSTIFVMFSYFCLGLWDDYLKILKKNPKGVRPRTKMLWQILTSVLLLGTLYKMDKLNTGFYVPFLKGQLFDLGIWQIFFGSLVIVGSSNAVNLTDGLDGLAIGPILTSSATFGILAYVAGHYELANYLYIPYIEGSGELVVLTSAIFGAGLGFLWFNAYPAQIFMGDVGSLSLGGGLGALAVLTKNEILFLLIGGIFVAEAVSVILQVGSFKMRKKRIFKMAPIHHHFELKGWHESKVIVRFWIISVVLAMLSIATIKIR
jgi:phospho-N-acetylmuramoyl-pentapeptide-transferase